MIRASAMTVELPSATLTNFIWFLVVLNIFLFLYINSHAKGMSSNAPLVRGKPGHFGHWCGGLGFVFGAAKAIDLGYHQNHDIYQVKRLSDYYVITSNPKYIKELTEAPETVLSMTQQLRDEMQSDHTLPGVFDDGFVGVREQYHLRFIKTFIINRLPHIYALFTNEAEYQFGELMKGADEREIAVSPYEVSKIVLSTGNNRCLVGPTLCRDTVYIDVIVNLIIEAFTSGLLIRYLPSFLKGFVERYIRGGHRSRAIVHDRVIALINERTRKAAAGDTEKADDGIQVLMDNPPDFQSWTPMDISMSILILNIAAVNLTVQAFAHCMFDIAQQAEFIPGLREEITKAVEEEGAWSKAAIDKMLKLDSFVKESQRVHPHRIAVCGRVAQQDFTFSNGITLPKGTEVGVPIQSLAMDDKHFASAHEFDGLRFYNENEDIPANRLSSATCDPPMLGWGYGKHVCPGKAWASLALKSLCAHLIYHYDIRLPEVSKRPEDMNFFVLTSVDQKAKVLCKRRDVKCYDIKE